MRRLLFFGAALVLAACTGAPEAARSEAPKPAAGGYQPAQANDDIIKAAERLAVAEIYRRDPQRGILEQVTREQQVVAGMNYRFTIKMTGPKDLVEQNLKAYDAFLGSVAPGAVRPPRE